MRAKVGLQEERAGDEELIRDLLGLLQESHADYTIVFRELGTFSSVEGATNEKLREHFMNRDRFDEWALRYRNRLRSERSRDDDRLLRMNRVNPKYVLRNYLAQVAIEKAQQKDYSEIDRLLTLLHNPYRDQPEMDGYAAPPPNWGKHLAVSCSS
jgi:uncharacterized protein YdiU (UPF0061 family)